MASCVANIIQESSNGLAIVPYSSNVVVDPVVLVVEPISSTKVNPINVPVNLTPPTNPNNAVTNNVVLDPIPISLYQPGSPASGPRKRKLRSSKVTGIEHNHRFIRRVFRGNHIEYMWEKEARTFNTIPMLQSDGGFKHQLLDNWTVENRIRQDGKTKERYFTHPNVKRQFRSVKVVQKFLSIMIDGKKGKEIIAEKKEECKNEVERFLAESYENLMNYYF